jgi:ATP citrate (pro-S)-lyase
MASSSSSTARLPAGHLFSRDTQAIFYNYKPSPVQRMLDFDYLCKRATPSVAALVTPGTTRGNQKVFFGANEILLPVYGSVVEACSDHAGASVFINFASFRSAAASAMEALEQPSIQVVVIIAEGIPEMDSRRMIARARRLGKTIVGPATVGGVQAGAFKIGDTAGTVDNILRCKLYRPGSVGFVSKSGGLSNEMYNILARTTDGLFEGIAIGGDAFAGSTLSEHVIRYEAMEQVKMIVVLGEIGGIDEYDIAAAVRDGRATKPLIAWVSGTCAKMFPTEVQFGHAGAKSGKDAESAEAKNGALRSAGALVPTSFEGLPELIGATYRDLVDSGAIVERDEPEPPTLPTDWTTAFRGGRVRRSTGIVSTICDDRGEEPTYAGVPISELITSQASIGDVIGLLWFKRKLPEYASKFIELVLMLAADHGPCVSGAHNTIVAARAGKDLVSCVASGMLTIGPRFGGAIDGAARHFKEAVDAQLTADEFVESMKRRGLRIPGIGHRIKSADNLDKRVVLMKNYAATNFPATRYLDFALQVEQFTLKKASNLVLNVDGCIAALFLDLMDSSPSFSDTEIQEIVDIGYLNGLFILARTIGFIGHALDQQRLQQGLYRHAYDDTLYA